MTLISYHSSGGDEGRCDAKCYNAKHPQCDCICGGRNHGAGQQQAEANTKELFNEWMEDWQKKHPNDTVCIPDEIRQTDMFGKESTR